MVSAVYISNFKAPLFSKISPLCIYRKNRQYSEIYRVNTEISLHVLNICKLPHIDRLVYMMTYAKIAKFRFASCVMVLSLSNIMKYNISLFQLTNVSRNIWSIFENHKNWSNNEFYYHCMWDSSWNKLVYIMCVN